MLGERLEAFAAAARHDHRQGSAGQTADVASGIIAGSVSHLRSLTHSAERLHQVSGASFQAFVRLRFMSAVEAVYFEFGDRAVRKDRRPGGCRRRVGAQLAAPWATRFAPSCRCTPVVRRAHPELQPRAAVQQVALIIGDTEYVFSLQTANFPGTQAPMYFIDCPALFEPRRVYTLTTRMSIGASCCLPARRLESCRRLQIRRRIYFIAMTGTPHSCRCISRPSTAAMRCSARAKSLLTIHNIGYQGILPSAAAAGSWGWRRRWSQLDQDDIAHGVINSLKTGIKFADKVSTVSPTYAREICETPLGMGLQGALARRADRVVGILNGVDYQEWDPRHDPHLTAHFRAARFARQAHQQGNR